MKALTVQQPWAWAIVHGGKTVENRTQAWKYRGPLAIHAGFRLSERGCELLPDLLGATQGADDLLWEYMRAELVYGAIIGTVQLVDAHLAQPDCCDSPWAEQSYDEHGGRTRRDIVHLVLDDAQPIDPIPCRGRLGLWAPPTEVLVQLEMSGALR
ncbi:ASCH domain-containing protein [Nocardioides sp. L-11A]|uniref:ASCH domain-containing protein n=1 Tax=Nocardioides sp. L-11A TaxID=3043848 RepID=UPI00249AF999|nr:ASCH domain-containing protein [Nocardioides sp. L-11A]